MDYGLFKSQILANYLSPSRSIGFQMLNINGENFYDDEEKQAAFLGFRKGKMGTYYY